MRYHNVEATRRYVIYLLKNGTYSKEFNATDDIQAKLITKRIHGKECHNVALFRVGGYTTDGNRRIKGIQL